MTAKLNKKCIRSNRKSVKNSSRWYARLYERFRPAGLDLPSRFAFSHPQPGKSLPPPQGFAHGAAAVLADAVRRVRCVTEWGWTSLPLRQQPS